MTAPPRHPQSHVNRLQRLVRQDHPAGILQRRRHDPGKQFESSIYHADAERDEYFSPRVYALAQTSFDHNFAQDLDLEQIYGAGIGWTAIKNPTEELDVKSTLQYEGQTFISTASQDQNLIGSTVSGAWTAKLPFRSQFKQQVSWTPAYNNPNAYSAAETNALTVPFFKSLALSVGSNESYLNDPPRLAAHQTQFVRVHDRADLFDQIEILIGQ